MSGSLCSLSEWPAEDKALLRLEVDYLGAGDTDAFRAACLSLLQTGRTHLVIDLRPLRRVPSGAVGAVIDVGLLTYNNLGPGGGVMVLAQPGVAEQFRTFANAPAIEIRECDPDEEAHSPIAGNLDSPAMAGS